MMMNAGSYIDIGSTHSLCQDYVIARNGPGSEGPYVILSDGCSSSPDTDIGARLLVRAMDRNLAVSSTSEVEELHKESARLALGWAGLMGLPAQSVDATLMSAGLTGDKLIIACSGDGVIVLETQEGVLDVYAISSPSGYPFYPAYAHQPERLAELVINGRTRKELKRFRRDSVDEHLRLIDITTSDSLTEVLKLNASEYKYAAVASDGIDSFFLTQQSAGGRKVEAVCLTAVVEQLWSFKNSHGAFVERRMKRFKKDSQATGWHHADDLAISAIHLGAEHVRHR
jgi:hypothetical protein